MNKHKKNKTSGITILSLVITVIVLLILAGISVSMLTGNNGIILNAGKAKESVGLSQEAEKIDNAVLKTSGKTKFGDITVPVLQNELDEEFGENQAEAMDNGDTIVVKIEERYYEIDQNGNLSGPITLEKIEYAGDITKGGTCTGIQDNPYRIECIEDLVALSTRAANKKTNNKNSFYVLTRDLDFKSIFSYANYKAKYKYDSETDSYVPDESSETTIKELCTTGQGFIPIGLSYDDITFQGTFDGKYNEKSHKISNIYINREGVATLFGAAKSAKIKNLTIDGHIISTNSTATGIAGTAFSTTISKCYNKAKIEGKTGAAGIFSSGGATITECGNEGEITSIGGSAAGISKDSGTISKCYNKGNVTSGGHASGIVGPRNGGSAISNCYNSGNITSGTGICTASGIKTWEGSGLYNCYNTGKITGACVKKSNARWGIARSLSNIYSLCSECNKLLFIWRTYNYEWN